MDNKNLASRNDRASQWQQLQQMTEPWDVLVAGGGITGAGVAREAARRGLRVLLVERQDFAWGTSSRSSKMVHGGLRYMAAGDFRTTRHSVQERERLLREAPGLVELMPYVMPHYRGHFPGPFLFNALLWLYDAFAGKRYRRFHKAAAFHAQVPFLYDDGLTGATEFADAVTDDARLVLRVLREAQQDGAQTLNYVGVEQLVQQNGRVCGAVLKDALSGQQCDVRAQVVINATGAWVDELRGQLQQAPKIRPARGSHIVVAAERLPVTMAFTILHPDDQRPIFVYPWEGRTVIGTTDLDHPGLGNEEVGISRSELEYLLKLAAHRFPAAALTEQDVIASWAGVRPLVSSGALNPSKEKRDHSVWDDQGLVSVSGGKLTTFRLIALDALNAARRYLTHWPAGDFPTQIFRPYKPQHPSWSALPAAIQQRLLGYYGQDTDALLQRAQSGELTVIPGTHTLWAELRFAAACEAVQHLDDLLLRRTRIGLLLEQGGMLWAEKIRAVCQPELGWSDEHWTAEQQRYEQIWQRYYSLPAAVQALS
ncbi:FAD-dependent oxidoreductase [Oceanospirillaceae bacterium ASx5O]|nr:FAD-dependent oxidoreductase [Oceanospirillaceae bacterium ASx5O]